VHESKDRAKDASSSRMQISHPSSACALWRMRTTFPSSAPFGHPLSSVHAFCGRIPTKAHGPTEVLVPTTLREERRLPENRDAFHRHTYAKESHVAERLLSPAFAPASRSRRPHFVPRLGQCFGWALQGTDAVTRFVRAARECKRLFDSLELPRLELTFQARHRARPTRPSTRTDCLARTDADRSA
jgi:hypothetical protein